MLLDFDGTLVDTRKAVMDSVRQTLSKIGATALDEKSLADLIALGLSMPETFLRVVPNASPDQVSHCVEVYRTLYQELERDHTVVFEGVPATLKDLAAMGLKMAIVSNKGTAAVVRSLQRFGLNEFIDQVFGAEDGCPTKPDPALYDLRIQPTYSDIPKSAFLMIGDTTADLLFANGVGITSCWASYGFGDPASCRPLNPRFVIESFPDLLSTVLENRATA